MQVKDGNGWHCSWEDAKPHVATNRSKLDPTMFPPAGASNPETSEMQTDDATDTTANASAAVAAVANGEGEQKKDDAEEKKAGEKKEKVVETPAHTHEHPLELCMRFLPHHQDTGGFFVAVLEKVSECTDLVVPRNAQRAAKAGRQNGKAADKEGNAKRV